MKNYQIEGLTQKKLIQAIATNGRIESENLWLVFKTEKSIFDDVRTTAIGEFHTKNIKFCISFNSSEMEAIIAGGIDVFNTVLERELEYHYNMMRYQIFSRNTLKGVE